MKVRLVNCVPLSVMILLGIPKQQTIDLKNLTADCAVAFLETSGLNFAAMVATQSLLVASGSHSSLKTVFLKEQRVILPQLLLLELIISEHSR